MGGEAWRSVSGHAKLCIDAARGPPLPRRPRRPPDRPVPVRGHEGTPHREPPRPLRPSGPGRRHGVRERGDRAGDEGPLPLAHALQPGRAARGTRGTDTRRHTRGHGRTADLAHVRIALRPVPRHAVEALARPHAARGLRRDGTAHHRQCRRRLRRNLGPPAARGLPAAVALRAMGHHVPRHDRRRPRPAGFARAAPPIRLDRPRRADLPPGRCRRPRTTRVPRPPRNIERHHGNGHPRLGRLSRRPAQPTRRVRGGGSDRVRPRASFTCHRRSLPSRSREPLRSDCGGDGSAGRRRAVPRPDARRNGRHEHRRRPDVADPRRRLARSQSAGGRALRTRPGGRHPQAGRLCRRTQTAPRPLRERAPADRHRLHARRDHLQQGAGARWPGTTRRSASGLPGGSSTAPRGYAASTDRSSRRPGSPTRSASTTTLVRC